MVIHATLIPESTTKINEIKDELNSQLATIDNASRPFVSFHLPYLFSHKTGFSSLSRMTTNNKISTMKFCCNTNSPFTNSPKNLELSYKIDLDFLDFSDCYGRKKTLSYYLRHTVDP